MNEFQLIDFFKDYNRLRRLKSSRVFWDFFFFKDLKNRIQLEFLRHSSENIRKILGILNFKRTKMIWLFQSSLKWATESVIADNRQSTAYRRPRRRLLWLSQLFGDPSCSKIDPLRQLTKIAEYLHVLLARIRSSYL